MLVRHALVVLALSMCLPATAFAQARGTLNRFRAAPTPEDDFHLSRPNDLGHLRFGVHLTADYSLNSLVYESVRGDSSTERFAAVEHQLTGVLGLSFGLFDRLVVFGGLSFVPMMRGDRDPVFEALGTARADGAGLGDTYLGARVRLWGESSDLFALALQATLTLPTSGVPGDSSYRGEPAASILPMLIGELRPGIGARIVVNVGARVREESSAALANLRFGHELVYGLGASVPLLTDADERTHLDVLAQIYGDSDFTQFGERDGTALEATLGMRFFHASGVAVGIAAGPGLTRGFGSPDVRAIATLGWASPATPAEDTSSDRDGDGLLDTSDQCPDAPEDADGFEDGDGCPDPDNDRDGLPDTSDQCPLEPETANSWSDEDGCPDEIPDTDGDSVRDNVDRCIDQPEDRDAFRDEDGCPEPDNDEDGVLDTADRCPAQAGPIENVGCPDTDRDGDTVVDRIDNCPDEAGTVENRGCQAVQRVTIEEGRLQILEMVFFQTNRDTILARSHPLLLNVAQVLNAHPEIRHVIIEGHTDSRGNRQRNIELSQRRAESVVRFLVERGQVAAERLTARGFGPDSPQVPDARTAEDHARNRRVEFRILGDENDIVSRTESEASTDSIDR